MRIVLQRVAQAAVEVEGREVSRIGTGLVALVCVTHGDDAAVVTAAARKVAGLRLFEDAAGKMNLDLAAVGGELLVVSQFTLVADTSRGRRPSFEGAAAAGLWPCALCRRRHGRMGAPRLAGGRARWLKEARWRL